MKQWLQSGTKSTVRLMISYLAVLLAVSTIYSIVMYSITSRELVLQLRSPNSGAQMITGKDISGSFPPPGGPKITAAKSKGNLARNLVLLNVGVAVLGVPLCYVLARRTLQPIEASMDNQARFSSDAAHELRTPVAALKVSNEVALRNPKLTLSQAKNVIRNSVEQTARLEQLAESLLQLTGSHKPPIKAPMRLEDSANEAINICLQRAQAKNISISDEVMDVTVMANPQDIIQVLCILLDNAIKYSPAKSTITVSSAKDAKNGRIIVTDQGQGIRATDVPRIFERFYRADHARSANDSHSYGLGLSIAQKLVEQNDGAISVRSTLGSGSEFTVTLPLST